MKLASAAIVSLSLLTASGAFASQVLADDPNAGPEPSARTIVMAECIAYTVASQDGQAKDMSKERKEWIIAFAEPFNLEADIDGLNDDQRQTIVVEKLQEQYALKRKEGAAALERLHKEKCEGELRGITEGLQ